MAIHSVTIGSCTWFMVRIEAGNVKTAHRRAIETQEALHGWVVHVATDLIGGRIHSRSSTCRRVALARIWITQFRRAQVGAVPPTAVVAALFVGAIRCAVGVRDTHAGLLVAGLIFTQIRAKTATLVGATHLAITHGRAVLTLTGLWVACAGARDGALTRASVLSPTDLGQAVGLARIRGCSLKTG